MFNQGESAWKQAMSAMPFMERGDCCVDRFRTVGLKLSLHFRFILTVTWRWMAKDMSLDMHLRNSDMNSWTNCYRYLWEDERILAYVFGKTRCHRMHSAQTSAAGCVAGESDTIPYLPPSPNGRQILKITSDIRSECFREAARRIQSRPIDNGDHNVFRQFSFSINVL